MTSHLPLEIFCVALSIIGAIFVSQKANNSRLIGFLFWTVSNVGFVALTLLIGHYPMAAMYVFFLAMAIIGVINNWSET